MSIKTSVFEYEFDGGTVSLDFYDKETGCVGRVEWQFHTNKTTNRCAFKPFHERPAWLASGYASFSDLSASDQKKVIDARGRFVRKFIKTGITFV